MVTENHGPFGMIEIFSGSGGLVGIAVQKGNYDAGHWHNHIRGSGFLCKLVSPGGHAPWVYVDAVRRSGGVPVLLRQGGEEDEARAAVAGRDGLVVSGGPYADPVGCGPARHSE